MKKFTSIALKAGFFCTHPWKMYWVTSLICSVLYISGRMSNLHFRDELPISSTLCYPCVQKNMIKITSLHPQNVISLSLFRQHHPLDTVWNARLCLFSQVLKHRLGICSFPHSFHTLRQPEQKPLSQKTVISSRRYLRKGENGGRGLRIPVQP